MMQAWCSKAGGCGNGDGEHGAWGMGHGAWYSRGVAVIGTAGALGRLEQNRPHQNDKAEAVLNERVNSPVDKEIEKHHRWHLGRLTEHLMGLDGVR